MGYNFKYAHWIDIVAEQVIYKNSTGELKYLTKINDYPAHRELMKAHLWPNCKWPEVHVFRKFKSIFSVSYETFVD